MQILFNNLFLNSKKKTTEIHINKLVRLDEDRTADSMFVLEFSNTNKKSAGEST